MHALFEMRLFISLYIFCGIHGLTNIGEISDSKQLVDYGRTAQVHCNSNDGDHNFMFWEFGYNVIIGPGNKYNKSKYEYEVLTGDLYIMVIYLQ